jgi:putative ATP-binding cassette transporter
MSTEQAEMGAEMHEAPPLRAVFGAFFRLTCGFWQGATALRAFALTLGLIAGLTLMMGVNVFMNAWQGWFFNALEKRDPSALREAMVLFPIVIASSAMVGVAIVYFRETLQVRWREWITARLCQRWLAGNAVSRLKTSGFEPANPEYRIADDSRMAVEHLTDLVIGLATALLSAITFVQILWIVGGSTRVTIGSLSWHIPAYFVLAALVYGILATGLMLLIGRPLVWKVAARNEAEARFRATLTLARDRAGSAGFDLAASRSEAGAAYGTVVLRWIAVIWQHCRITWITNGNAPIVAGLPLLLAAPKYLSGELTLGDVVRLATAFAQVQAAISWLVDNFRIVAPCAASCGRVVALDAALARLDAEPLLPEAARAPAE